MHPRRQSSFLSLCGGAARGRPPVSAWSRRGPRAGSRAGFTLIELIATLVLSGVLIALMLPLIGAGLTESTRPLTSSPQTYALRSQMEACWHLYRSVHGNDLPALSAAIDAAALEEGFLIHYNDWVRFDSATGQEVATPGETENILRITIGNAQGDRLTAYFAPLQP